jgi:hypothetical protein
MKLAAFTQNHLYNFFPYPCAFWPLAFCQYPLHLEDSQVLLLIVLEFLNLMLFPIPSNTSRSSKKTPFGTRGCVGFKLLWNAWAVVQ